MAKKSKSLPVLVFAKNGNTEVRVELTEYKGNHILNIREWWFSADADEMKPGKGVTVPHAYAADFLEQLETFAAELREAMPEAPEPEAAAIKKGSRVVLKNGDEGVVVKIKDDVAHVVIDGDDDDELTRVKLSKLELAPEKKAKKKKSKVVEEDDEDEDETPKKKKKKRSANDDADDELQDLEDDEPKKKSKMKGGVKVSKKDNKKIDKKTKAKKKSRSL